MKGNSPAADPGGGEFRRGWRTVFAAAVGFACGTGAAPFFTLGVFMGPLRDAFGWTRTELAAVTLITTIAMVATAGLVGRAADRIGVRKIAVSSLALTALSYIGFCFVNGSIWSFYAAWLLMNLVGAGTAPMIWTRGVAIGFKRQRGLAIGLVLMGSGITGFVAPPFVNLAIQIFGWRGGYLALSAFVGLIGLPVILAFFFEVGERREDQAEVAVSAPPLLGASSC